MIALLAGRGRLPGLLFEALAGQGAAPLVCALEGQPPEVPPGAEVLTYRIETLGRLLDTLLARGVRALCLCGGLSRPDIDPAAVDPATAPLLGRLRAAFDQGDDGTLRALIAILEEAGFGIVGAHEIRPDLLLPEGVPTRAQPSRDAEQAARFGLSEIAGLGARDAGQACIVAGGRIVGAEGPDGTDAMLRAAGSDARGAVLVKAPKPGQDRRADLPAIGPGTARAARAAGLAGVVIEAGGVLALDPGDTVAAFDEAGLFLWVRPPGAGP